MSLLAPSPLDNLLSFTRKSRLPKPIALHRCPFKKIPAACTGPTDESDASCSAPSSASPSDSASSTSTSKIRCYPSKCKSMVVVGRVAAILPKSPRYFSQSGISAILLMPMPFLDKEKDGHVAEELDSKPRSMRRILFRQSRPKAGRRRNALILPEVDIPDVPDANCPAQPYECSKRESQPPMADRAVRFSIPREIFDRRQNAGRRPDDEEPAWYNLTMNLTTQGT
ncbi:hypothetical protein K438DRAFT_1788571 [Mycena galopus ATCC 62051]|nr:hypothetical protein K438DRAFT_1788571 [Mycena galopus ATCC 62051]